MAENKRNVLIMSLLDSAPQAATNIAPTEGSTTNGASSIPLQNFVSQFQTSIFPTTTESTNTQVLNGVPQLVLSSKNMNSVIQSNSPPQIVGDGSPLKLVNTTIPSAFISEHIKRFQTSFQLPQALSPSRTSIKSIMNIESDGEVFEVASSPDPTPLPLGVPQASTAPTSVPISTPPSSKRKTKKKDDGPVKKKKPEPKKLDKDGKPEPRKSKSKKKTPEASKALEPVQPVAQPLLATLTTEKSSTSTRVKLLAPTIIDLLNDYSDDNSNSGSQMQLPETTDTKVADKEKEKREKEKADREKAEKEKAEKDKAEKEAAPPLIIALNVPLLDPKDPKPGQSEVVVNVLKLSEEKYGWSAIHPNAKSAIDIMDDILDEDDDAIDEDEEEDDEEEEKAKKKKEDEGLTEEQLVRRHEVRMNRRVGKYDYEDPFIDDIELQMEEEITTTKEGFFVYWGPIVDDRTPSAKKSGSKKK